MQVRNIIVRALNHARVTADGQSPPTDTELATGLDQLIHLLSMNFYVRAHTLGFLKQHLTLEVTDNQCTLPAGYANVKEAAYAGSDGRVRNLARGTETDLLATLANSRRPQRDNPTKYVKEYSADGVLSMQLIPYTKAGHVTVAAFRRLPLPTSLTDELQLPPEWETPVIFALAALLVSHYAIRGPEGQARLASALWEATMIVNGSRGSLALE